MLCTSWPVKPVVLIMSAVVLLPNSGLVLTTTSPVNNRHKSEIVPRQNLHNHFDLPRHSGFFDFEFTLIDQGNNLECTRKRERFLAIQTQHLSP